MKERLKRGTIEEGKGGKRYIYMGGDDTDPENWKPVNPVTLPSLQESMAQELENRSFLEKFNAGWGIAGLDRPALGLKKAAVGLTPEDEQRLALGRQIQQTIPGRIGGAGGIISTLYAPGAAVGSVAAQAPTAGTRIAADLAGQAALGAGYGALAEPENRLQGAVTGGIAGGVGSLVSQALQGLLRPGVRSAAAQLEKEGVPVTPGQASPQSSFTRWFEERARIGSTAVAKRQAESLEQWSANTVNKTLPPGVKPLPGGPDLIKNAAESFDNAYSAAFSKAGPISPDVILQKELTKNFRDLVPKLTATDANTLREQLMRIPGEFQGGKIDPEALKSLRHSFQELSTSAYKEGGGRLGEAYANTAKLLDGLLKRQAPKAAAEIAAIDSKYAQFLRVQTAAGKVGVDEGVFTPNQLLSAIREMDKTANKRAFARGTTVSELLGIAKTGKKVLGSTIPPVGPGTAEKAVVPLISQNPLATIPYAAAQLGYSKPAQWALMGRHGLASGPLGILPAGAAPAAVSERENMLKFLMGVR